MIAYHLVVVSDATFFGGAERVLELLLGALEPAARVTVLGQDASVIERLAAARPGTAAVVVPADVRLLRQTMRRLAPDVVHANLTSMRSCRAAIFAALTLRVPVVLVDHLPLPSLRARGRLLQRLLTRLAAARLSVGFKSSRLVEQIVGLRPGSVRTIHNGVPAFATQPPQPVPGRLRVAVICRLVSHKGVDTLLRAVAETPEVIATIAGTGELEGQLRELADELGCASRVNFAGWSDPVSVLSTVDAVVLPSRDEGLPLVMLEAMRAGFPVIATSVGSVTEALEDGVTGLVIPPEDHVALVRSLRRFAASPSLREQLGTAAKARGEAFSVEAMAGAYQQVYVAALTRRRRQSQLSSR